MLTILFFPIIFFISVLIFTIITLVDLSKNQILREGKFYLISQFIYLALTFIFLIIYLNTNLLGTISITYRIFAILSIISFIGSIITFIVYLINRPSPVKIPSPIPQPTITPAKTQVLTHEMQKAAEIHMYFDNKLYKTYPISHHSYIIGREGDIKTPDEDIYVSRKQLQLNVDSINKIYYLYLLPSKNPVYINDKRFGFEIKSPYILRDGDKIKIGNRTFLLFRKI